MANSDVNDRSVIERFEHDDELTGHDSHASHGKEDRKDPEDPNDRQDRQDYSTRPKRKPEHLWEALQWTHTEPKLYLPKLVQRFGDPSSIDPSPGGQVVWKANRLHNTVFDQVVLKDELVDGIDFLSICVKYRVDPSKFTEVMGLTGAHTAHMTGSINYDIQTQQLCARASSLEACVAVLSLAVYVGEGYISLAFVEANDVLTQWTTIDSKTQAKVDRMYEILKFNLRRQKAGTAQLETLPEAVGTNFSLV